MATAITPIADSDPGLYLQDERFSRKFEMPAEPGQSKPFVVTYSDFGYRDPENPQNERVLLFCSPLLGSRFLHVSKDQLAKEHHVRFICPDRPGFGGTTNVDLVDRVGTWLKIVPALLKHLGVKYVSVASHSGGSIYALNTLLYLRHLLHPAKPYVALCAPWVHPSRSGVPLMKLASILPHGLLNQFDAAVELVNTRIQPMIGSSSAFSSSLSSSLHFTRNNHPLASETDTSAIQFEEQLFPSIISRVHLEDVQGLNSDAFLLLKRAGGPDIWGPWVDCDGFVPLLAEQESNRARSTDCLDQASPLTLEVFFAEKDAMIGTSAGPKWFNECWRPEQRGNRIDYSSTFVGGTDHENLLQTEFGVTQQIFTRLPEHGK